MLRPSTRPQSISPLRIWQVCTSRPCQRLQFWRPKSFCPLTALLRLLAAPTTAASIGQCPRLNERNRNSQSHATVHTLPLCPLNVPNRSPFEVYQTLTTLSFEAEKRRSPSALKMICVSDRSCPWRMIGFWRQRKPNHCPVMGPVTSSSARPPDPERPSSVTLPPFHTAHTCSPQVWRSCSFATYHFDVDL